MLFMTSCFIQSILYLTLSSNMLTQHNLRFTTARCEVGYWINTMFIGLNYIILCSLFLHRIYSLFKDSMFEYNKWIYRAFIVVLIGVLPILYILLNAPQITSTKHEIVYDPQTNLAMCLQWPSGTSSMITLIVVILMGITLPSLSIGLLILFLRGLWRLNGHRIEHFLDRQSRTLNSVELQSKSKSKDEKIADVVLRAATDDMESQKGLNPELERIITLHNLMKKQTILVCVSIISTTLYFVGTSVNNIMYGTSM